YAYNRAPAATQNPEPRTQNPEPRTKNPERGTQNPNRTLHPAPKTLNPTDVPRHPLPATHPQRQQRGRRDADRVAARACGAADRPAPAASPARTRRDGRIVFAAVRDEPAQRDPAGDLGVRPRRA